MIASYLFDKYKEELTEILDKLQSAHDTLSKTKSSKVAGIRQEIIDGNVTGSIAGLTPFPDALYLYLLVREYKPETIFEIGTWVGTSALFMAEALKKNGTGHIYTCDSNEYYILPEEYAELVTPITGHSDAVLADLKTKGTQFDFMFIDGNLTSQSTQLIAETTHENTVFAIHDFVLPDDKGIQAFLRLPQKKHYGLAVPHPYQAPTADITINKMTAVYLPSATLPNTTGLKRGATLRAYRLYLPLSYTLGHAARKLRSLFK